MFSSRKQAKIDTVYQPPNQLLWWDDASYIAYQSRDPFADEQAEYYADIARRMHVATLHTLDYCGGWTHGPHCPKPPTEDLPF